MAGYRRPEERGHPCCMWGNGTSQGPAPFLLPPMVVHESCVMFLRHPSNQLHSVIQRESKRRALVVLSRHKVCKSEESK